MAKAFECGDEIVSKKERNNKSYVVIDVTSNLVCFHEIGDRSTTYWRNVNTMELKSEAVR